MARKLILTIRTVTFCIIHTNPQCSVSFLSPLVVFFYPYASNKMPKVMAYVKIRLQYRAMKLVLTFLPFSCDKLSNSYRLSSDNLKMLVGEMSSSSTCKLGLNKAD